MSSCKSVLSQMFKLREMFTKQVSGERVGQVLEFWERHPGPV